MKCNLLVIICCSLACFAQQKQRQKPCRQQEAQAADSRIDQLKSWSLVHDFYSEFSNCDDGGIAEGVSDAVGKLLADHWETLDCLQKMTSVDTGFQKFVIRHLDGTLPAETLQKIASNAQKRCSNNAKSLCSEIRQAALRK